MSERPGDRAAAIYRALRQAIIEQALAPGAKLPEDAIGEKFGASRTIVRRALSQLAADGLVDLRPNRGAAVATPSWEEAHDTFEARLAMERLVVSRLVGNLTKDQVRKLNEHVVAEERTQGQSEPRSIRLATEFHLLLAEMTGSPVLLRYVTELGLRCGLILALYARPHSSDCAISEHREIIEALVAGDEARAIAVMDQHLHAVTSRALITQRSAKGRDIQDILAMYAEPNVSKSGSKRRA
ncbi:putative HTH-type transcriptional regulator YdfH [Variibacter gotjawalensis]|uniref:Putative HTH-type transcriptional regulator YdfH n=1 Tax=Variibacter gotjawalensis TaxID=1333996 RepID=A0A0S3PSJ8_9BRAD|nr:GntR family transcriptional regulator [Variibacter gotjawalensis]NIK49205.1 DNA-binding GntR family transcriptional regulator [Variibacter gotjawalensis]RZS51059.1 DNA-binding GntR family transcriptional regulator [Variibacter gotjawalensis]BAT58893.1 putative HTH-type transcriptional regulator YdfH [Variibacter gotjawalensis]